MKSKTKKQVKQNVKKIVKKSNSITLVCAILFLIIGLLGGVFTYKLISKNDTFTLIGQKEITLVKNSKYIENGVKIISFGKDISKSVEIRGSVNESVVGQYVLTYVVKDIKFGNVKKIRIVNIVEDAHE